MSMRATSVAIWMVAWPAWSATPVADARDVDEPASRIKTFETGLSPAVTIRGQPRVRWTIEERMEYWKVSGVSVAVVRGGRISWTKGYGVLQRASGTEVDTNTVFSVGSLSKVVAAAMALRLVDAGEVTLDRDVNAFLKRWQVPSSPIANGKSVTLRGILSHTAGLSVSGFGNFEPGAPYPSALETLDGVPPARTDPVQIIYEPGTEARYSGGGTTIAEVLVEDLTGMPFADAAAELLFVPLDMSRSTFSNPLPESHGNIARAHDNDGEAAALPRGWETMPQMAASGLWTTPADYARFLIAIMKSYNGHGGFLSQDLARQMLTAVGPSSFGLGPALSGRGYGRRLSHAGGNDSYRAYMEAFPATEDALVVFTNSRSSLNLIREIMRSLAETEGLGTGLKADAPGISLDHGWLDQLVGDYEVADIPFLQQLRMREKRSRYRVTRQGDSLLVDIRSGDRDTPRVAGRAVLVPLSPTHFVLDEVTSSSNDLQYFEFVPGYDGAIASLLVRIGDNVAEANKIEAGAAAGSRPDSRTSTAEQQDTK